MTAYALKNPVFRKIVSTQVKTVPWPGEQWHRKWYNKNKMLRLYPGGDGVKTGFTKLSRRTLVSSATREGRQIATVTLNAPDDWERSMQLLEYGFRHFQRVQLVKKGEEFSPSQKGRAPMEIVASRSFTYPLTEEERDPGGSAPHDHLSSEKGEVCRDPCGYSPDFRGRKARRFHPF